MLVEYGIEGQRSHFVRSDHLEQLIVLLRRILFSKWKSSAKSYIAEFNGVEKYLVVNIKLGKEKL